MVMNKKVVIGLSIAAIIIAVAVFGYVLTGDKIVGTYRYTTDENTYELTFFRDGVFSGEIYSSTGDSIDKHWYSWERADLNNYYRSGNNTFILSNDKKTLTEVYKNHKIVYTRIR